MPKGTGFHGFMRLLIEPVWNRNTITADKSVLDLTFNRTSMESKQCRWYRNKISLHPFNRTSMESKH